MPQLRAGGPNASIKAKKICSGPWWPQSCVQALEGIGAVVAKRAECGAFMGCGLGQDGAVQVWAMQAA